MISKIEAVGIYATTLLRNERNALIITTEVEADLNRMVEALISHGFNPRVNRSYGGSGIRLDHLRPSVEFKFCDRDRGNVESTLRGWGGLVFLAVPLSSLTDTTLASLQFGAKTEYLR